MKGIITNYGTFNSNMNQAYTALYCIMKEFLLGLGKLDAEGRLLVIDNHFAM